MSEVMWIVTNHEEKLAERLFRANPLRFFVMSDVMWVVTNLSMYVVCNVVLRALWIRMQAGSGVSQRGLKLRATRWLGPLTLLFCFFVCEAEIRLV